ncbi:MAG: DUF4384 domain-containing protein [Pseudomonadota bacterium]
MNKFALNFVICWLLFNKAFAISTFKISASGEHAWGPNETQAQACELAKSKAKKDALIKHFGELVGQKSLLECDASIQKATGNDCELFESSWSLINSNGYIKGTDFKETPYFSELQKANVCRVEGIVIIEEFAGKADASFQTKVALTGGLTLRVGDQPQIRIKSNKAAYHYVFYWAPYHDRDNYYRIFPNAVDRQSMASQQLTIPSAEAKKPYNIDVTLPKDSDVSSEYLILLSFKETLQDVPETISESGFFSWLQSFRRDLWTQDKMSYRIIGDSI